MVTTSSLCTPIYVERALQYINELRYGATTKLNIDRKASAEHLASLLFQADMRLAVYGSLAPGKENHHHLLDISGNWTQGHAEGIIKNAEWQNEDGYPTFEWKPGMNQVKVHVLTSPSLTDHWARLDHFEGDDYQRILVPVFIDEAHPVIANIYESRVH